MTPRELTPAEARVLPFRRPASAVRVRRASLWTTLGRPFLQALGLVGVPALLVTWALTSTSFAIAAVDVEAVERVDAEWVATAVAEFTGQNIFRVPLAEVRDRLARHPWIESVEIEKRLPDRLLLTLVERSPAALYRDGEELWYLDRGGRKIARFEPSREAVDLVLVGSERSRPAALRGAVEVVDELAAATPSWGRTLSEVVAIGGDDYRLYLGALPFPLLVRRGTLAVRLPRLATLLPDLEARYARIAFVDLRSERRIVFQPVSERS